MATISNQKSVGIFPARFNKRENKLASSNYSSIELTSAEAYQITDTDGVDFVHVDGASTVTLPQAASNKGRVITFRAHSTAAVVIARNATDLANINKAAADFTAMQTADEWVQLFCTGTEWLIVASRTA